MYQIVKGDAVLGYVENPVCIIKLDNGDFGLAPKSKDVGIVFGGAQYNIDGNKVIDEKLETVSIYDVDGGLLLNELNNQVKADLDYLAVMGGVEL